MSIASKYGSLLRDARRGIAYWAQIAKRDFTDDLLMWMERRQVKQGQLAELLGVSPQFVTKVLRTNANLTIETMTKLAAALGCQVRIHLADRNAATEWRDRPNNVSRFNLTTASNVIPLNVRNIRSTTNADSSEPTRFVVNGQRR